MASNSNSQSGQATTPSGTPDENERRAQDCRAKAAYCKFLADREPDKQLRKYYTQLSAAWEKEAEKGDKSNPPARR
jgi:hypothetical protein